MDTIEVLGLPAPVPEWALYTAVAMLCLVVVVTARRTARKPRGFHVVWPGKNGHPACRVLVWSRPTRKSSGGRPDELLPFIDWDARPPRAESLDSRTYRSRGIAAKPDAVLEDARGAVYVVEIKSRHAPVGRTLGVRFWMELCQVVASASAISRPGARTHPVLVYADAVMVITKWDGLENRVLALVPSCRALPGQTGLVAASTLGRYAGLLFQMGCYNGTEAARQYGKDYHRAVTERLEKACNDV